MSGGGTMPSCADRLAALGTVGETDIVTGELAQGPTASAHGCGAQQTLNVGNNRVTAWPSCQQGWIHRDYFMLGKGHGFVPTDWPEEIMTHDKRLVEMHGGAVALASDGQGAGSEFSFTIPLAESAPAVAPESTRPRLGARRILVVDDQPDNADMFAAMLEQLGQEVQVAYGGSAAIEIAKEFRPQVAFLDLSMPDLGGRELAHRLRVDFPKSDLALVALTGFGSEHPDARDPEFARHPTDWPEEA
jgi:CheY-like chemotaxis protein